jgi:glycosyltransferase involved in cell wall biosynthesis
MIKNITKKTNYKTAEYPKKSSQRLSVAIITLNEADRLSACLQSVNFADEIVIVDSGSQDDTVNIAKSFGCKIIEHPWLGFSRQKQFAVDNCSNDWILIIDADERISRETGVEIHNVLEGHLENDYVAYSFQRKNFFRNRWIRHCGWWPERVVRLVDRRHGAFNDKLVHEKWIPTGKVTNLESCIEHYSFRDYSDLIKKMQLYSTLSSRHLFIKGKRCYWWTPILHGLWTFLATYFFRLGFLDGFDGFVISLMNSGGSFMKYAKLKELQYVNEGQTMKQ